ncbi:MAG TPA: ABC transporter permease [Thermoanaerobaculia bacterium]|nr:ABC transporter permease [Thermoanaerobaculia bacterium]
MRFLHDLRIAARALAKAPGFTLAAVLTLALGIGANTAIFSVVDAVLLETLPVREPGKLLHVWRADDRSPDSALAPGPFLDLDRDLTTVSGFAAFNDTSFNLTGLGDPRRVDSASVSGDFFTVLGVEAARGRVFTEATEDEKTAVVTDGFFRHQLGSREEALGEALVLNGEPYTLVGVLAEDFHLPALREAEVYAVGPHGVPHSPLPLGDTDVTTLRDFNYLEAVARIAPGATTADVRQELAALAGRYAEANVDEEGNSYPFDYLARRSTGEVRPVLMVLLGAVGLVLLIACVNVASLMLSRTLVQRRDHAVRAALGASRWRLMREVAAEGACLTLAGGTLGLLLGPWAQAGLVALAPPSLRGLESLGLDGTVLAFTMLVSFASLFLFTLVPAYQASRPDLRGPLAGGGQRGGSARSLTRTLLVVTETALAVVLLIGAGLLVRSLLSLQSEDPGFRADDLLTLRIALPEGEYSEEPQVAAFYDQLLDRLGALPGVETATLVNTLPFSGSRAILGFQVEGALLPPGQSHVTGYRVVDPAYFETMGIDRLSGRGFTEGDTLESPTVALVNTTFVHQVLDGADPIGRRINFGDFEDAEDWVTIVGVVEPVRHMGYDDALAPETYLSYRQDPWGFATLVLDPAPGIEPTSLAEPARRALLAQSSTVPFYDVKTAAEVMGGTLAARRFLVLLVGIFAALAVTLAAIGIYGVVSYSVMQRRREIGIRMALGSTRREVLSVVMRRGLGLVALGVTAGVAVALPLSRLLSGMLYGVTSTDPATYAAVAALLLTVAGLAAATPAARASRLDPMRTLRED